MLLEAIVVRVFYDPEKAGLYAVACGGVFVEALAEHRL